MIYIFCSVSFGCLVAFFLLHSEVTAEARISVNRIDGPAGEEDDALQLLVVEEVVERPQAARFPKWVRVQIRIVAVDVTVVEGNLILDRGPEGGADLVILLAGHCREVALDRVENPLERRFLAELVALRIAEIVVRLESRVERCNQIEQGLARDGIAQGGPFVSGQRTTEQLGRKILQGLRRRKGLQIGGRLLRGEPLVQSLIVAGHLAGIALDATVNRSVAGHDMKGVVDRLKTSALQKLHFDQSVATVRYAMN